MNIRIFLLSGASLLLANYALAIDGSEKKLDIYIDESGRKGAHDPFVIGALIVDSGFKYSRLGDIRKETKFKQVLRYSSSNKYKRILAFPFLKEFFDSKMMSFFSIVIPATINNQWSSSKKERASMYQHNYSKFIKKIGDKANVINIILENRSVTGEDKYIKEFLEQNNSQVHVAFQKEKENDCIQLSDVITGSIYGEMTDVKDKTKLEIIAEIKRYLNVSKIAEVGNLKGGKFSVQIAKQLQIE